MRLGVGRTMFLLTMSFVWVWQMAHLRQPRPMSSKSWDSTARPCTQCFHSFQWLSSSFLCFRKSPANWQREELRMVGVPTLTRRVGLDWWVKLNKACGRSQHWASVPEWPTTAPLRKPCPPKSSHSSSKSVGFRSCSDDHFRFSLPCFGLPRGPGLWVTTFAESRRSSGRTTWDGHRSMPARHSKWQRRSLGHHHRDHRRTKPAHSTWHSTY